MLRLKKIILKNVGRFSGTHEIFLENRPLVIQIDAINRNTGGSSGSGKSTVFHAFEYNLGVNATPSTVLQSRLTKEPMEVTGIYDYNGEEVAVKRSKSLLEITSPSKTVTGSVEEAEKFLDQLIGVPRKLLRNLIHKRQKEGGFFINMTPKECHTFLAECTDLNSWIDKSKKAETNLSETNKTLISAESQVNVAFAALESRKCSYQQISNNAPIRPDIVPEALEKLEKVIEKENELLASLSNKMQKNLEAITMPSRPLSASTESLEKEKSKLLALKSQLDIERKKQSDQISEKNKAVSSVEQKLSKIAFFKRDKDNLTLELEKAKKEIFHIKEKKCPTCLQNWSNGSEEEHLNSIVINAKNIFISIQNLEKEITTEADLRVQLEKAKLELEEEKAKGSFSELTTAISIQEAAIESKQIEISKIDKAQTDAYAAALKVSASEKEAVRQKYNNEISQSQASIIKLKETLASKKAMLASYNASKESYDRSLAQASLSISDAEKALERAQDSLLSLKKKALLAETAVKTIRSFVNQTFQDTLNTIAAKASEMLSRVPNTATMTVHFEGFKETKSGTVKEEVTAILNMDGELNVPIKSMSGGESTMVNLAIDLATIDIVEQRAGKGLDIFILDEPFDGLDSVCREQCLELLKNSASGKRVLIVDHSNETKELVSDRIYIVRDGQNSSICDTI